jgi:ATP-dependent Lhr-like helicase
MRGGRKNPPAIQRMESDDLMAAVFPVLAACQENVAPGPMEIPDQVLVRQTLEDCLHEAMDINGLRSMVAGIESGQITVLVRDTTEPSVLAHQILNGAPFTYLDDGEFENRRSRNVRVPRGLPVDARDLARLDPDAISRVRSEVRPTPRDADELHDLLLTLYLMRPVPAWAQFFAELTAAGRAGTASDGAFWCATERRALVTGPACDPEVAAEMLRGHLDVLGPVTVPELVSATGLTASDAELALIRLENEGFALRGRFSDPNGAEEFCARRLLARIHAYTRERRRREIEPVTPRDFMRFLLRWQHVADGTRREGSSGVLAVVEQLQGFELAAGAWEKSVLAARVTGYQREWLDGLCLSGEVAWGRLSLRPDDTEDVPRGRGLSPSRATPITLTVREDLPWLLRAARGDRAPVQPGPGRTLDVIAALAGRGALFPPDLAASTGRLPSEIEEALWEGVARGLVTADGFRAVRTLLARRLLASASGGGFGVAQTRRRLRRAGQHTTPAGGRWSLLPSATPDCDPDELAEAVAEQLAVRWGVVFHDLIVRENVAVPWREILWAFRRLEARGLIRGGRFVSGFSGEQYAHPDAVDVLRQVRKQPRNGETVRLSAVDPLNLIGVILPGTRVPAVLTNTVTYVDGALPPVPEAENADLVLPA